MAIVGSLYNYKTRAWEKINFNCDHKLVRCLLVDPESKGCFMYYHNGIYWAENHYGSSLTHIMSPLLDNMIYAYGMVDGVAPEDYNSLTDEQSQNVSDMINKFRTACYLYVKKYNNENRFVLFFKNFTKSNINMYHGNYKEYHIDRESFDLMPYPTRFYNNQKSQNQEFKIFCCNSYTHGRIGKFLRLKNNKYGLIYYNPPNMCYLDLHQFKKQIGNMNLNNTQNDDEILKLVRRIPITQELITHDLTRHDSSQLVYFKMIFPLCETDISPDNIPVIYLIKQEDTGIYQLNFKAKLVFFDFVNMKINSSLDLYIPSDNILKRNLEIFVASTDAISRVDISPKFILSDLDKKPLFLDVIFYEQLEKQEGMVVPSNDLKRTIADRRKVYKYRYNISELIHKNKEEYLLDSDIIINTSADKKKDEGEYTSKDKMKVYIRSYKPSYHGKNKPRFFLKKEYVNSDVRKLDIYDSEGSNSVFPSSNIETEFYNKFGIYNVKYKDEKFILKTFINKDNSIISKVLKDIRFSSFDFLSPWANYQKDLTTGEIKSTMTKDGYIEQARGYGSLERNIYHDFLNPYYNQLIYNSKYSKRIENEQMLIPPNVVNTIIHNGVTHMNRRLTRRNAFRHYQTMHGRSPINEYFSFYMPYSTGFTNRDVGLLQTQMSEVLFLGSPSFDIYDAFACYTGEWMHLYDKKFDKSIMLDYSMNKMKLDFFFYYAMTAYWSSYIKNNIGSGQIYTLNPSYMFIPFANGFIPECYSFGKKIDKRVLFKEDTDFISKLDYFDIVSR